MRYQQAMAARGRPSSQWHRRDLVNHAQVWKAVQSWRKIPGGRLPNDVVLLNIMKLTSIYDGIWWYMMVYDGKWWYMMVYDGIWWYMMVYDGIWWYMMGYDGIWWYMMVYDGIWWYMGCPFVLLNTIVTYIIINHYQPFLVVILAMN